jgi:hypothetical protein
VRCCGRCYGGIKEVDDGIWIVSFMHRVITHSGRLMSQYEFNYYINGVRKQVKIGRHGTVTPDRIASDGDCGVIIL